jgi:nucleoside-diphosphate-sugar epimerase
VRFLVTGATGYVGSALTRRLVQQGHEVTAVVLQGTTIEPLKPYPDIHIVMYDGGMPSLATAFHARGYDFVIHVASCVLVSHKAQDVDRLLAANVLFPTQLLELMREYECRDFINVGTYWQHYQDAAYDPVNLYAATKQSLQDILTYYVNAHDMRAITLILYDPYGPGDTRPKLFKLLRETAISGTELKMSPGEQYLDFVYIEDVVDAFLAATQRLSTISGAESYAVRSGVSMPLKDIVKLYEQIVNKKIRVKWGGLSYRPREVMVPWQGGNILPGWTAKMSLRDGIKKMESDPSINGLLPCV